MSWDMIADQAEMEGEGARVCVSLFCAFVCLSVCLCVGPYVAL